VEFAFVLELNSFFEETICIYFLVKMIDEFYNFYSLYRTNVL
jgi:hypothetical protein